MFNRLVASFFLWATALLLCCPSPARADQAFTLANGLRVRLVPEADAGNVCVLLAVPAGILHEGKHEAHLAHLAEHTSVYDLGDTELAETVKRWFGQGKANAETLGELMYFDLRCGQDELPTALAIQAARLGKMNYTGKTLEREIPRALAEVDHLSRQPGGMGKFALIPFVQAALYGQTDVPLRSLTKKIGIEAVRTFHDRWFQVRSATLVVVGDFDGPQVRKEIEQTFGALAKNENATPVRPALTPGKRRVKWDLPKRHWLVAWRTPNATEADHAAVWLASRLLQNQLFDAAGRAGAPGQFQVNTDLDQILLIGREVEDEQGFEAARNTVMRQIERLSRPGGIEPAALQRCCDQFDAFQKTDLGKIQLPPTVTRGMARTNIELQRLLVESLSGNWEQFLRKLKAVSSSSAESAVRKWLSAERACFVEVVQEQDR